MELTIDLSQKQFLSQRMVQSVEILQMSTQELESYVEELSLENPVIELKESHGQQQESAQRQLEILRKLEWMESGDYQNRSYYKEDRTAENMQENWHGAHKPGETLREHLYTQLLLQEYTKQERAILDFIICSLDSRGYFTDSIEETANYFSTSEKKILALLQDVQRLEPAGIGARNLQECLLLQLKRKDSYSELSEVLIREYLNDLGKNHLRIIAGKLHVSQESVQRAYEEIRSLHPKPGSMFENMEAACYIKADALVLQLDGRLEVLLAENQQSYFSIDSYYQTLYKETRDAEARAYLRDKIAQAEFVAHCISQRASTLSRVIQSIVKRQERFFLYGTDYLVPMRLMDLAEELQLHESTISRAMKGKYIQCVYGIFPLQYFLTAVAVRSTHTELEITAQQIKSFIEQIVREEDKRKPLSDQSIADQLKKQDIEISRRTVNKYRCEMGIPDKSGRKA